MTFVRPRGACPSLAAPMETGDGLLARLVLNAPIALDDFIGLCEAARAHGNGTIEVSARGSLQIRGLSSDSASQFAGAIAALDIDIDEGVPVIADPLPHDPAALIDANGVATDLRRAIAEAGLSLSPKVSIIVDGSGGIDLDALTADIRLRANPTGEGTKLQLSLAGDAASAVPVGTCSTGEVIDKVLVLLKLIAARGSEARAKDVLPELTEPPFQRTRSHKSSRACAIGRQPLKGGAVALGLGLAFGHAEAGALLALAEIAEANGAHWARPAPDRALLFGPLTGANAIAVRREAERLGLVTEARDPRRRIVACPGAPSCAQGLIAARALAAELAGQVSLTGNGIALHISGCAKGCAHAKPAPLTLVGTEQGCGIVKNGTARDKPMRYADPADLSVELDGVTAKTREAVHA
jgi:precorrin-3B synthase